jgi:hypothetical protein
MCQQHWNFFTMVIELQTLKQQMSLNQTCQPVYYIYVCVCLLKLLAILLLAVLGFELVLLLARQGLSHLSHVSRPFFLLVIFQIRACVFTWAWPQVKIPPSMASQVAWATDVYHRTQFIGWDGVSLAFCPGWPLTVVLLVSVSWVAGITDMNHHAWHLKQC